MMKVLEKAAVAFLAGLAIIAPSTASEKQQTGERQTATQPGTFEVRVVRDLPYVNGPAEDANRQKLDLYLPVGQKNHPVMLFLHGGGFTNGDRKDIERLGQWLARHGVGVAAAGYRLHPAARHPAQIQDAARALSWLNKNITAYGGRNDRLFLGGFSAGGHLAALLATDERYLKVVGLNPSVLKGVIALSGPYRLSEARQAVFGDNASRQDASPIRHVKGNLPPILLIVADKDAPNHSQWTREFAEAIKTNQGQVEVHTGKDRTHATLFSRLGEGDLTTAVILDFVERHVPAEAANASNR
jgi:acetyl esterase/lipase